MKLVFCYRFLNKNNLFLDKKLTHFEKPSKDIIKKTDVSNK